MACSGHSLFAAINICYFIIKDSQYMIQEQHETLIDEYHWDSCCGKTSDKRLLIFAANLSISMILMIFSLVRLTQTNISNDDKQTYVGFVSLIVGIWIKSPLS